MGPKLDLASLVVPPEAQIGTGGPSMRRMTVLWLWWFSNDCTTSAMRHFQNMAQMALFLQVVRVALIS